MIGRTLTHYKVVAELGAGGMGVVYKALDLRLERHVALKILPPEKSGDHGRRARFLHEARAASALNDPHIVTIFDIFTDDATDVLVMELVSGRTLRQILDEGPLALAKAIDIVLQVAEGVGTAHAAGIVHRDLKPGNVMVTDRGAVKILDFGLAKFVGAESFADQRTTLAPETVAGMLLGTVDYMSPEQAHGDAIDARSDVFSLGGMFYEMLTGARPFVGRQPLGVLHEIVYGTIVPPRQKRPEISAGIEALVLRALERDLARRCPSMESFARDLRIELRRLDAASEPVAPAAASSVASMPLVPPPLPSRASQSPPIVPPPLPSPLPPPAGAKREPVAERPAVSGRPAPADGFAPQPEASSIPAVAWPGARLPRSRRPNRQFGVKRSRRKRWMTALVVVMVILGFNWARDVTTSISNRRPNVAGEPRQPGPPADSPLLNGHRLGTAVEDAVAGMLNSLGPDSPGLQLARAQIYWKRAQQNGDAALRQKAEDTFNDVLRLNPDADEAAEAREGLREIAAAKAPAAEP
jgi:serine/threonine protein kinase